MRRRKLVAAVAGAVTLTGCSAGYREDQAERGEETDTPADDDQIEASSLAEQGLPPTVCREQIQPGGIVAIGDLVMYDGRTGSYWSQLLAQAICGPQRKRRLSIRPSTVTTLGEWRGEHPDTDVLLPPPASTLVDPPVTK